MCGAAATGRQCRNTQRRQVCVIIALPFGFNQSAKPQSASTNTIRMEIIKKRGEIDVSQGDVDVKVVVSKLHCRRNLGPLLHRE